MAKKLIEKVATGQEALTIDAYKTWYEANKPLINGNLVKENPETWNWVEGAPLTFVMQGRDRYTSARQVAKMAGKLYDLCASPAFAGHEVDMREHPLEGQEQWAFKCMVAMADDSVIMVFPETTTTDEKDITRRQPMAVINGEVTTFENWKGVEAFFGVGSEAKKEAKKAEAQAKKLAKANEAAETPAKEQKTAKKKVAKKNPFVDQPEAVVTEAETPELVVEPVAEGEGIATALPGTKIEISREQLIAALEGNSPGEVRTRQEAADFLGISKSTLIRRMKEFSL